jgi:hypothetical protein
MNRPHRVSASRTAIIAVVTLGAGLAGAPPAQATNPTGYLEVCKSASGSGVTGTFEFTVAGAGKVTAPVGGCSPAVQVKAGSVVVTEVARAGFTVEDVTAVPAGTLTAKDPAAGTATVTVAAGGIGNQTIVTFKNKVTPPTKGRVKVCKQAGPGVDAGQEFGFTVGTAAVTAKAGFCSTPVDVAAGEVTVTENATAGIGVTAIASAPAGTLVSSDLAARTARIKVVGGQVTEVTYTNAKKTGQVKVCKIAGPGVAAGTSFTFTVGSSTTTAKAGYCSEPLEVAVGDVTVVETAAAGYEVSAIAVAGAGTLKSKDLAAGKAVVTVAPGTTEVQYTNKGKNKPPSCTLTVTPKELWPPNHKFRTVTVAGATDADDDDTVSYQIVSVTQDEALNDDGDGNTSPDAAVVAGRGDQVQVRAERSGNGDGRVYRITVRASDGKGGSCTGTVTVGVPHDRSNRPIVDSGLIVDSFG